MMFTETYLVCVLVAAQVHPCPFIPGWQHDPRKLNIALLSEGIFVGYDAVKIESPTVSGMKFGDLRSAQIPVTPPPHVNNLARTQGRKTSRLGGHREIEIIRKGAGQKSELGVIPKLVRWGLADISDGRPGLKLKFVVWPLIHKHSGLSNDVSPELTLSDVLRDPHLEHAHPKKQKSKNRDRVPAEPEYPMPDTISEAWLPGCFALVGIGLAALGLAAYEGRPRISIGIYAVGGLLFVIGLFGLSDVLCGAGNCQ